jgi:ATP-dependent DNA ligase
LGPAAEWIAEWKWDGIRSQLIRRAGTTLLWSRGEELLTGRFPEVEEAGALLPEGTVLDGELLPWIGDMPLPFAQLQRRIGRKALRRKGDWWKWKVEPYSVDAVLMYAQPGSGRRAGLFTDYTFGLWDGDRLMPFAKAYSGLTDEEIRRVDAFVRRNTLEKHGPVRVVKPELVFELAFEGIQASSRHKSGIAVRFPRMARWRTDKRVEDADSLGTVRALLTPP